MMFTRKSKKKAEKLNLIPILDSVFIFIFFLLMSAQFLQIYEIGSDAPAVKTTESIKDDKPPLNLTLVIDKNKIEIKTGVPEVTYREIASIDNDYNILELQKVLFELKNQHQDEKSIIFRPNSTVNYRQIVILMDAVREYRETNKVPSVMFNQIIFETII